jgi:hypothetical protein
MASCDDCEFVGPIKYARNERRCDWLQYNRAPEWLTSSLRHLQQYGQPDRAEECGGYAPKTTREGEG